MLAPEGKTLQSVSHGACCREQVLFAEIQRRTAEEHRGAPCLAHIGRERGKSRLDEPALSSEVGLAKASDTLLGNTEAGLSEEVLDWLVLAIPQLPRASPRSEERDVGVQKVRLLRRDDLLEVRTGDRRRPECIEDGV